MFMGILSDEIVCHSFGLYYR